MKYFIFLVLVIIILGLVYLFSTSKNSAPATNPEPIVNQEAQVQSAKITAEKAVEKVKNLAEVQDYLKRVPNGKVVADNESDGKYNVQVYEIKDGHTATFNWYYVNVSDGEITPEFTITLGTVSGKLCYPSEVLPKGKIEYKRISDGKIEYEDYLGSQNSGGNTFSLQLEEGEYYIRYKVSESLIGYSTTVCPSGNETTCGDTKRRILVKATVKPGQSVSDYNLCDFYYSDKNAPVF